MHLKTIDIITYCEWNSYGSILQAYALKRYLEKKDCKLNHLRLNTISAKKLELYFKGKSVKNILINIDRFFNRKKLQRRYNLALQFFKENFNFLTYETYEQLKEQPPQADAFIAGSDQIWNPYSLNPLFYLDFVENKQKKVAYAASMGKTSFPKEQKDIWYDFINEFAHISVREDEIKKIINERLEKNVDVNIDPTFLIDKEEWKSIENPYPIKKPYILVYALYWDKKFNAQLRELHKKTGLTIVTIASQLQNVYAQKRIYDASVEEFLWLFDNAEYVITSSFHGAAFSIIFEKKFSIIVNPKKPSRFNELLDIFGIENTPITKLDEYDGPNYDKVKNIISKERNLTDEYFKKAIDIE